MSLNDVKQKAKNLVDDAKEAADKVRGKIDSQFHDEDEPGDEYDKNSLGAKIKGKFRDAKEDVKNAADKAQNKAERIKEDLDDDEDDD